MSTLPLPAGNFKAYLFDCDGTIADSMPIHYRAWSRAMENYGVNFTEDLFYGWAGIPVPKTVEMLNELQGLNMPPIEVSEMREKYYLEMLEQVKPVESVLWHILDQHGKIPLAVVSGSPRGSVIRTLTYLGILDRFDTIVGAEDYVRGKPDPEPFLTAARRLGVAPKDCLVFEDGKLGIESAVAAGMAAVFVPSRK